MDATALLRAWSEGDQSALNELVPLVERELHRLARAYMCRERQDHTLQATALVNEVFLRLAHGGNAEFASDSPRFDAAGNILFRGTVDGTSFIYRVRQGRAPEKALQQPVLFFQTTSPDGAWLLARVQPGDRQDGYQVNVAFPTAGGAPVRLCDNDCDVDWTSNGKSLVIRLNAGEVARTFLVSLESGSMLPRWPARGIRSRDDLNHLRIAREVEGWIYPSDTGVYLRVRAEYDAAEHSSRPAPIIAIDVSTFATNLKNHAPARRDSVPAGARGAGRISASHRPG